MTEIHDDRKIRLLIVDDDARLAGALRAALQRRGYIVEHAPTAGAALSAEPFDLVLLDLGLPDADGIDLCRHIRKETEAGIIIVTGRTAQPDRIAGLEAGADDYILKPFGLLELTARLQAVLRRYQQGGSPLAVGPLALNPDRRTATLREVPLDLTNKEFQILRLLARTPGSVVPRERLVSEVWRTAWLGKSRTVDVHIATLRAKLGDAVAIENVRGVGYRLMAPVSADGKLHTG